MNCISDTIIWHWQEVKEEWQKLSAGERERSSTVDIRLRARFCDGNCWHSQLPATHQHLQFDIDSDIEILWLHCRSIRFGCSVPRRSPFTEMIYKLRLVSLLDEICSCPQRNQRLNGFRNIMHILTLQREDQVVSPSTATTFCKMLHFLFDFFTGENERIIVQQFRI